jgi:predicted nucleic acid-binding protein
MMGSTGGAMISTAIVDSGPLLAVANRADPDHQRCLEVLEDSLLRLVIPAMCVAEVSYLLGSRMGPAIEARFLRGLELFHVEAPKADDWIRMAELVELYSDFPLGGTDASVAVLAERFETDLVVTLDRRHFSAIVPRHCRRFRLLPDS